MFHFRRQFFELFQTSMLRTRLVLGLVCLLIILLATGLYSIRQCADLGSTFESIFVENYTSINAMQQIKLACARLNAAVVMKLSGEHEESMGIYRLNTRILLDNLKIQQAQVHQPEEKAATRKLEALIQTYLEDSQRFFALPPGQKTVPKSYVSDLSPGLISVADTAEFIQDLNQKALLARKNGYGETIRSTIRFLLLAMIIAVVVSLYASFRLGRSILQPIADLTASIHAIGQGNLDQQVPVSSQDELGQLAQTFNLMAGQLRTYRASTSEKIVRLHKTMQTTLASFPDPIFVLDPEGQIELKNPAASQLATKLVLQGIQHFPPLVEQKIQQVLSSQQDYVTDKLGDAIRFHIDNEDRFYLLRVLLLRDEENKIFGVAAILEEVTKLRLLDDMKSSLVATVSHELKTPLTSVRTALHLLTEQMVGPLNEQQHELLETARNDSERLLRTLNNLLDLARLEEAAAGLQRENVPVRELIQTAVEQTRSAAREHHLGVEVSVAGELPPLLVDPYRFGHVLTNFINNAIKHSPPEGRVTITARRQDHAVRISVLDQGPGIPAEHLPRIFEKFYRVPGQSKTGAGLGLAIAREIALAHGGTVGVLIPASGGSEFYVDLPLSPEPDPDTISET